jgi:glutamate/tyrosine decarboxylase-like PLP-dependent enzyme
MITYEDSPVFTMMQDSVLAALRRRVFGSSIGDGIIADGGSMANQFAIAIARRHKFLAVKEGGFHAVKKKLILYMSEDAHYSTTKGALFQGLYFK